MIRRVRLAELAHARSGDKGSDANIGVIARRPEDYPVLRRSLTAEAVRSYLAPMGLDSVERYELANLGALNFVVRGILDGGGSRSPRIDPQGKALAQVLLDMELTLAPAEQSQPTAGHAELGPSVGPALPAAELVTRSRRGRAAVLILNRPQRRNALNSALLVELLTGLSWAESEPGVRAIVLTGSGTAFCAGMDLEEVAGQCGAGAAGVASESAARLLELLRRLAVCPIPTVAAVNGPAVAGGAGLMSACDFAVLSRTARVGYPEVRRGLVAAMVMSFLVRQVGDRPARRLLLEGELIEPEEAVAIGLATEVVEPDQLLPRVDQLVERLGLAGPAALTATKKLLAELGHGPLLADLDLAQETHLTARLSEEAREGISAFRERRLPSWAAAHTGSAPAPSGLASAPRTPSPSEPGRPF